MRAPQPFAAALLLAFSCTLFSAASCAPPSPEAGGGAAAIETQDDDGSDPGIGSDPGGDPNWSWSPPANLPVDDPGADPDPSSGTDPMGGDPPPLPPVGGYRPPHPPRVAILWIGAPYRGADFPFKVVKKWDGKDGAGGWQRATKRFEFVVRDEQTGLHVDDWTCGIEVGMAVQSRVDGYISPYDAALATADVANFALPVVSNSRTSWKGLSALFCSKLRGTMLTAFKGGMYKGYGATVSKWGP